MEVFITFVVETPAQLITKSNRPDGHISRDKEMNKFRSYNKDNPIP